MIIMAKKLINLLLCTAVLLGGKIYANPRDQSAFMKYYEKISKSKFANSGCLANCINTIIGCLHPSPKNYFIFGYAFQKYYQNNSKIKEYYEKRGNGKILFKREYDIWKFDGFPEVTEVYETQKSSKNEIISEKNPYVYLIDKNLNGYFENGEILIDPLKDGLNNNEKKVSIADFY